MGMSASQVYLLGITSRLADNELRSQTINNAKMRLATQSSQASEDYINALNESSLMFSNYDSTGTSQSQLLTYNSLTSYSSYNNQYGVVDSSGLLLVSESEAAMYENSGENLNAYLKLHGLEYDTTYFDAQTGSVGTITNSEYISPYNSISSSSLKTMYENYNAGKGSVEANLYNYYYAYQTNTDNLKTAVKEILKKYLTDTGRSTDDLYYKSVMNPSTNTSKNLYTLDYGSTTSMSALISKFKAAFTNSTSNVYAYNSSSPNTGIGNYLTTEGKSYYQQLLDGIQSTSSGATIGTIVDVDPATFASGTAKTYKIDNDIEVSVDASGKVTNITIPANTTDTTYTSLYDNSSLASNPNLTLKQVVDGISMTSNSGSSSIPSKYNLNIDASNNITASLISTYSNSSQLTYALAQTSNAILDQIASGDAFEYEKFANALTNGTVNYDTTLSSGKTLSSLVNSYNESKKNFLSLIFGKDTDSYRSASDKLLDGTIAPKNLSTVDSVLKLCKTNGWSISSQYTTVANNYIIKNMISETGEPKYSWIDKNDTGNTGNADAKAQWYTNLFNRMKKGYKAIENGLASSNEWLAFALESGSASMEQVDTTYNWQSLDYKTCCKITEQTDNNDTTSKAEAEYNRAMKDIDAKDSIYDIELKNIDTEHSALQTEYDSVKSVISKNIDRTFKFNQSA